MTRSGHCSMMVIKIKSALNGINIVIVGPTSDDKHGRSDGGEEQ